VGFAESDVDDFCNTNATDSDLGLALKSF